MADQPDHQQDLTAAPEESLEQTPAVPAEENNNQATGFLNLDSVIKNSIAQIEKLKQELKTQKEMLDSAFLNDEVYQEHERLAKEAAKVKTTTKQQIMKQPNIAGLAEKIKALKESLHELQESLSESLQQYQKMSGASQIEMEDGTVMELVSTVRLVKKSSSYRP